jgi:DNA transformation protein
MRALYCQRFESTLKLRDLKGLGPKSERCLNEVGIQTAEELHAIGAVRAFIKLKKECSTKPSLNFLYAMVGALENEHWAKVAKSERGRLLMELEGYKELEGIFQSEGLKIEI